MSEKLEQAIALATQLHQGATDKGGHPYINHPLRVMAAVEGEDDKIAAVLHDAIEDAGLTRERIAELFGIEVANAVEALSRRDGESYSQFIERVATNPIAVRVKTADLKDNMDLSRIPNPGERDYQRNRKYAKALKRLDLAPR